MFYLLNPGLVKKTPHDSVKTTGILAVGFQAHGSGHTEVTEGTVGFTNCSLNGSLRFSPAFDLNVCLRSSETLPTIRRLKVFSEIEKTSFNLIYKLCMKTKMAARWTPGEKTGKNIFLCWILVSGRFGFTEPEGSLCDPLLTGTNQPVIDQ